MPFSPGKEVLRICASSSLFLQRSGAWRIAPLASSRYLASNISCRYIRGGEARPGCLPASTRVSMGPIYGSANVGAKVGNIRSVLGDLQGHPADGLQVIMDFDLTMTAPGSEQCHHMFETSLALPEKLRRRLAPFFTGEIELATREAWWEGFHDVLVDARLTEAQVAAVAHGAKVLLRAGVAELMLLLQEQGVPLLVVSAGITDIVVETLRLNDLLLDNVTVRANTMHFGQDGELEGFRESPPVHSRNKHQTAEREQVYFDSHSHRRWLVIVGDKPGDADVNFGFVPDDQCLKIGFFDHSREHPHPDLPPLAVDLATPVAAVNNGHGRRTLQGLGFLQETNKALLLTESTVNTESADAPQGSGVTSRSEEKRIRGRPGSQGGGETFVFSVDNRRGLEGEKQQRQQQKQPNAAGATAAAAEELLRAYGDSFDIVACGGHSMDLVSDFVRHFVGGGEASAPGRVIAADTEAASGAERQQSASLRNR